MSFIFVMQKPAGTNVNNQDVNHTSSIMTSRIASSIRLMKVRLSVTTILVVAVGNNTNQSAH
jgi:hypothetical protein